MSLLSVDITKSKRLSLREVKLPTPKRTVEPTTPILIEKPPTDEEIAYSKIAEINPLIDDFVGRLNLVSHKTGERIRKVELLEDYSPSIIHPNDIERYKIIYVAQMVIDKESNHTKEEIISRLVSRTNMTPQSAKSYFTLMLDLSIIEQTINPELYYLATSTPF